MRFPFRCPSIRYRSKEMEVLNFGMAHYTCTPNTTNRVNLALIGEYIKPDIVVFLIGPNDFVCLYPRGYEPDGSHDGQWLLPIDAAIRGFRPIGNILKHSRVCSLVSGSIRKLLVFLEAAKLFHYRLSEENLLSRPEKMADHLTFFCALSRALGATWRRFAWAYPFFRRIWTYTALSCLLLSVICLTNSYPGKAEEHPEAFICFPFW